MTICRCVDGVSDHAIGCYTADPIIVQERMARLKSSRAVDFYGNAFLIALVAGWVGEPLSFLKNFQGLEWQLCM